MIYPTDNMLLANVKYGNSVGTSSDIFSLNSERLTKDNYIVAIVLIILGLVTIVFLIISYFNRKIKKVSKSYIDEIKSARNNRLKYKNPSPKKSQKKTYGLDDEGYLDLTK